MQNAIQYQRGYVLGTAAAININCGFIPRKVRLYNTEGLVQLDWNDSLNVGKTGSGSADGYGIKKITDGTISYITTGGITRGTRSTLLGFVIGADTDVNVSGEDIYWEAWE